MTFLVPALIVGSLGALAYASARRSIHPRPGPAVQEPAPVAAPDLDLPDHVWESCAVHEAGHALAAWFCLDVVTMRIEITKEAGHVLYQTRRWPRTAELDYASIVVTLAGVAAESIKFGRFIPREAAIDFEKALTLAEGIVQTWPERVPALAARPGRVKIANVYRTPPTEAERIVLEAAYADARELIVQKAELHATLAAHARRSAHVPMATIESVLGSRAVHDLCHFVGAFGIQVSVAPLRIREKS